MESGSALRCAGLTILVLAAVCRILLADISAREETFIAFVQRDRRDAPRERATNCKEIRHSSVARINHNPMVTDWYH
jgi:hypothetical protein